MPSAYTRVEADCKTPSVRSHIYADRPPITVVTVGGGIETLFDTGDQADADMARAIAAAYFDAAQRIERSAGITRPVIAAELVRHGGVTGISVTVLGGLPVIAAEPGTCDEIAAAFTRARNVLAVAQAEANDDAAVVKA